MQIVRNFLDEKNASETMDELIQVSRKASSPMQKYPRLNPITKHKRFLCGDFCRSDSSHKGCRSSGGGLENLVIPTFSSSSTALPIPLGHSAWPATLYVFQFEYWDISRMLPPFFHLSFFREVPFEDRRTPQSLGSGTNFDNFRVFRAFWSLLTQIPLPSLFS